MLACVGKLIAFRQMRARSFRQKRARNARRQEQTERPTKPFLWIIAAGRPAAVLAKLEPSSALGWPESVYFSAGLFRVGIVVASELPRDRSTLLVRLMAAGPLLPQAIEDLSALPDDAYERAVAEQILLNLQHALGKKPSRTPEEQEFIVTMQHTWEKARDDGQLDGVRLSLRRVFAARKLTPNPAEDAQIDACADLATLERWLDRALAAQSVAEVLRAAAVGSAKARRKTPRSL